MNKAFLLVDISLLFNFKPLKPSKLLVALVESKCGSFLSYITLNIYKVGLNSNKIVLVQHQNDPAECCPKCPRKE